MKLKFIRDHKSIGSDIKSCLESLEFPDFSIITGTNGSGKTHLLEAIKKGNINISIENIKEYRPIIYFSYQEFFLKSLSQGKGKTINNPRIDNIQSLYSHPRLDNRSYRFVLELESIHRLLADSPEFVKRNIMENTYDSILSDKEISLQNLIEKHSPKTFTESQKSGLLDLLNKFCFYFKQTIQLKPDVKHDEEIKEVIVTGKILHYNESHLGENLFNTVKHYFKQRFNARADTPENKPFDSKKYEEENGINPLVLFNQVLKSFSCNGYLFEEKYPSFPFKPSAMFKMPKEEFNDLPFSPALKNKDNSIQIGVDSLSSGEKTLLAIASLIHKRRQKSENDFISGVLLLDEIDTHLHPSMIKNMLKVINDIFIKKYKMKIIMVTHSPTTIALAPEDSLFVMDKNNTDKRIKKATNSEALNTLTEGFATLEEGTELIKLGKGKELVILTEGYNTDYINKAIELLASNLTEKIYVEKKLIDKTGVPQLITFFNFLSKLSLNNKFLFVFDCDSNISKLNNTDKVTAFKFDKNDQSRAQKGIENLFSKKFFKKDFYKKGIGDYGGEYEEFCKNKFKNHILKHGIEEDFKNFKSLIDKIKSLLIDQP